MPFEREELEKTARLCRIALTDEEVEELVGSLDPLVCLAERLCALPLEEGGVKKEKKTGVLRHDEVEKSTERELLLACAPQKREGFFLFEPSFKEGGQKR